MKQLLTILLISCSTFLNAQQLNNTSWNVYDSSSTLLITASFGIDTMYIPAAWTKYVENGNNFWTSDNPNNSCGGDSGTYTFLIQNDTLYFTMVNDTCTERVEFFEGFTWVDITTTIIENRTVFKGLNIYPNPTSGKLTISLEEGTASSVTIYNMHGQEVISKSIEPNSGEIQLSLGHLPPALYLVHILSDSGNIVTQQKVVKE